MKRLNRAISSRLRMKRFFNKSHLNTACKFKTFIPNFNSKWLLMGATGLTTGLIINEVEAEGVIDWVADNYKKVNIKDMNNVLKTEVLYTKTEGLEQDKPLLRIEVKVPNPAQYDNIIEIVRNNEELRHVDGSQDMIYILESLKSIHTELLLDKIDNIYIYKRGFNLICIKNNNNNIGKSAFIDIHAVRSKLSEIIDKKSSEAFLFTNVLLGASCAVLIAYTAIALV